MFLFLALATTATAGDPRTIPPAPGIPHFACVTAIDGIADSIGQRDFLLGFNSAFVEDAFATERESVRPGEMLASVPISNRFRLLHGDPEAGAWQVMIALQWTGAAKPPGAEDRPKSRAGATPTPRATPPRRGTSPRPPGGPRGEATPPLAGDTLEVVLTMTPPEANVAEESSPIARERLALGFPRAPRPEFARHTGRAVALVVLERLHHLTEDLAADERLRIEGARRLAPAPRLR